MASKTHTQTRAFVIQNRFVNGSHILVKGEFHSTILTFVFEVTYRSNDYPVTDRHIEQCTEKQENYITLLDHISFRFKNVHM